MIYILQSDLRGNKNAVTISGKNISIPFDPANTDYQQFKTDVLGGAELQDADGNLMTQATDYINTLP